MIDTKELDSQPSKGKVTNISDLVVRLDKKPQSEFVTQMTTNE